ncbi:uncharacterized protein BX663DRAFT_547367 [Cokeromyces recurvatus]|uniref:uncharacterized protein n=1 Tax=Cokeromyces recurvatus TaxID=90255 RepID=UPI00221F8288|nr:uncharacterized protein BX663DRAFT_547367 [Cokeromyces recurvatus]KAI7907675.1 hypothetical protein BX663DRAFT_547367 [Cokeromyces recurvatus]
MSEVIDQQEVYEAFKRYPWETDIVFQQGLQNIIENMPHMDINEDQVKLFDNLELVRAKHFYFSRFRQKFDFQKYLDYEMEEKLNGRKQEEKDEKEKEQEELFQRLEDYDYEKDADYVKGLPKIIHGWLEQQLKTELWDKERLDEEFSKAKAFYYASRVEHVDLKAYFSWKSKKNQANKPSCPFASLWQNKSKVKNLVETNGSSFIHAQKAHVFGAESITLSSPKSQNILSLSRLNDLKEVMKDGQDDDQVTSLLITATVSNDTNSTQFVENGRAKVISSGLAYDQISRMVSGSDLRQVSLEKLANAYYDIVRFIVQQGQTSPQQHHKKPVVTFSNGEIPLNAVYLTLSAGFSRVITEYGLLNFSLRPSHAPIPPLLLLAMVRNRTRNATTHNKVLPNGIELYLALSSPEYGKLRGSELLHLGLADIFIPEFKLNDAFKAAKNMSVCSASDIHAAIQSALIINHTYAGPSRFQVWEDLIEKVFGAAKSFDDLKSRLEAVDNHWSKTILAHWDTLPSVLLRVIFKAVKEYNNKSPLEMLALEQELNAKWRQTEDYKEWLRCKNTWVSDSEQVNSLVNDFYFTKDLELPNEEAVVYEAPQEEKEETKMMLPGVCPVTGQKSVSGAVCPVTGQQAIENDDISNNVCPVTGQKAEISPTTTTDNMKAASKCPFANRSTSSNNRVCPFTGQKSAA